MAPLIGYYAHHHGSGHRTRAHLVAAAYPGPVHVLGTGDPDADVMLPPDVDDDPGVVHEATAHGRLHWAPRHGRHLPDRAAAIVDWVRRARPALVVVDVSVEVALLVRLTGVPVVVVRQHGDRTDAPHQLVHDLADSLLAPYPAWAEDPGADDRMRAATTYVGGFSRHEGRERTGARRSDEVLVMAGTGGSGLDLDTIARLADGDDRRWTVIGVDGADRPGLRVLGTVADPWPLLCRAGVLITSAGHSALCEAAAADIATIAVVEERPFAEQARKVDVLAEAGVVHRAPSFDDDPAWAALVDRAAGARPRWRDFVDGRGRERAADHLAALAGTLHHGRRPRLEVVR